MSYNGSGTFNINSAGQPVVTGTVISAPTFNALTADLATGLSTALTKDGQSTPTANLTLGGYKLTNLAVGSAAADSVRMSQLQAGGTSYISVSGADTIVGSLSPTLTAYAAGNLFTFIAAGANTTAVTLNIDSLGAKSVTRDGTTALVAGDIASGEIVLVVYDGTRFQILNSNSFTNLNVSGTLAVTGATTLSSALTYGGITLSNAVTGTGNMVLSTSPTLVTPALGTPASGVVTNLTGTASININGTVGATTPAAGAFTTLSATGAVSGGAATFTTGTFSSNVTVTSAHVRANTTSNTPGTFNFYMAASGIREGTAGDVNIDTYSGAWGSRFAISQAGAVTIPGTLAVTGNLTIDTDTLFVDAANNRVGIGTSSPAYKLDAQTAETGTAAGDNTAGFFGSQASGRDVNIRFGDSVNASARIGYLSGSLYFYTNGTERARIDSSGNLLVGATTSLSASGGRTDVSVNGSSTAIVSLGIAGVRQGYFYAPSAGIILASETGTLNLQTSTAQPITFGINSVESMRIDSSGNLLVGTTSTSVAAGGIYNRGTHAAGSSVIIGHQTGVATGNSYSEFQYNGGLIGSITQSGTTAVLYNTTSDYRLKNNQAALTGSGAFIDALKPTTWEWAADGFAGVGFIAHEFQEVSPSSVSGEKDAMRDEEYEISPSVPAVVDEEGAVVSEAVEAVKGTRSVPQYQGMQASSSEVMANIIAELQMLRKRVAELEAAK